MYYRIMGKNIDIGDRTKDKVISKLERISKLFPEDATAQVVIASEKFTHKVEVTIPVKKHIIRAETSDNDMMAALDKSIDILEKQIVKYKKKVQAKEHKKSSIAPDISQIVEEDDDKIRIVKNKKFELRPMSSEEAVLQMELLGHSFFVFINADTDLVSVVYKRNDKTYGMIEPE